MTSIMKPGILVSVKTSIRGGVTYERKDLEAEEIQPGADVARWETTRVIEDPDEHLRATKARNEAANLIRRQCSATSFGLLCPITNEEGLDVAVRSAREIAATFNREASHSNVSVYVLKGRIAETDEEATRAIADEIRSLLEEMEQGVRDVDVKSIRSAAARAKEMNEMLEASQAETVKAAVDAARKAARQIVKRVEKGGENAEFVVRDLATGAIQKARFAFLDVGSDDLAVEGSAMPAVSTQRFAMLDTDAVEVA